LTSGPTKGKEKDKLTIVTTEGEKAKLTADLTECLRTYDILGLWRDAEDVIRRGVVRAFVKKVGSQMVLRLPWGVDAMVVDGTPWRLNSSTFPSRPPYPTGHCLQLTLHWDQSRNFWAQSPTNAIYALYSLRHETKSVRTLPVLITESCALIGRE
jgi:hypothetical protein